MDLPGWQALYEELGPRGLEIISVAEDTGGEAVAGEWFDRADATFTQIVDENHLISRLYNMVNVPTGVWIDEEGRIVRPNETAYTRNSDNAIAGKTMTIRGGDYVAALRDWVEKGADSEFSLSREQIVERLALRTTEQADADAYFQLGNHFHRTGDEELASRYWAEAQSRLPESWNYHRQDWSFTPEEAGAKWVQKYLALGDEEYYPAADLPRLAEEP